MGTGVIVQLLASNFPYPTPWLHTIGYIFWVSSESGYVQHESADSILLDLGHLPLRLVYYTRGS